MPERCIRYMRSCVMMGSLHSKSALAWDFRSASGIKTISEYFTLSQTTPSSIIVPMREQRKCNPDLTVPTLPLPDMV